MKNNALFAEGSDFNLGDYGAAGTVGNLTIQDNAQIILTGGGSVFVGKTAGSIGTVLQTGGTINARRTGVFQLAQQTGSVGTWLQSGGTNFGGGWVSIGRGATALDLTPTGLLVVSGGLFDQSSTGNGLIVGEQGTGTLTISNAGVVVSEANNIGVAIGWNQGAGVVNLDSGGTLVANFAQGGSGSSTFNFNGGVLRAGPSARLNFMSNLTAANVLLGAVIDTDTNAIAIAQPLLDGGLGGGLTKNGSGTLLLNGANSYSGTTTVTAGTLGGNGSLAGPLSVHSGATLSPGASIGTLTVNNTVTLAAGSTTLMELSKAAATNDQVICSSTLTYGGALVLKNLGGTLAVNDTFKLFSAAAYGGLFSGVVSETPGQTVTWDLSKLAVDGTVKVTSAVAAPVTLTPVVSGGSLTLSWPSSQLGWTLQEQVNPWAVGLGTNWVPVAGSTTTNQMSFTIDHTKGSVFFRLLFQ
jgi:autotransporter-associated beta strand protein/T5SS/PEP-CTERM-associated repeat protein